MSDSMVPVPPTSAIADPQVRAALDALAQNINVVRSEYVNSSNVRNYTQDAMVSLLRGDFMVDGESVENIYRSILSSALYQKLTEPFSVPLDNSKALVELENRVAAAVGTQQQLARKLTFETNARTSAIQAEAATRAQALLDEVAARGNAVSNLQTQINTLAAASTGDLGEVLAALQSEQTARAAGDAAEATSRETLATQLRGTYTGTDTAQLTTGLLYSERTARVSADGALNSAITALSSTVTNNYNTVTASITQEATTRANADAAEATARTALDTRVGAAESSITSLQTTTGTQATALTALTTRVGTAESSITSLQTTTASQASSLASLTTRVGTAESSISTLNTTTAGQATSISSLTSRMGSAESAITNETNARTSADAALTSSVSSLSSRMGSAESAITTEQSTRSTKDNAIAAAVNNIWAKMNGSGSAIDDGALAAVSPSAATATRWNSVIAAVTDPNTGQISSTSIRQELNSYANSANSTLNSSYTLRINNNGYITGFGLQSTTGAGGTPGASSDFVIMADRFSLVTPGANPVVPFTVSNGRAVFNGTLAAVNGTFSGNLSAAGGTFTGTLQGVNGTFSGTLTAATVQTENLVGQAVTASYGVSTSTYTMSTTVSVPSGTSTMIILVGLGQGVLTSYGESYQYSPPDGTLLVNGATAVTGQNSLVHSIPSPAAGTYTVTVNRGIGEGVMTLAVLVGKR